MAADISQEILIRIKNLEEKLSMKFELFRERFEEYRVLSENRKKPTTDEVPTAQEQNQLLQKEEKVAQLENELQTTRKKVDELQFVAAKREQKITQLEQELEIIQMKNKELEEQLKDLPKAHEIKVKFSGP